MEITFYEKMLPVFIREQFLFLVYLIFLTRKCFKIAFSCKFDFKLAFAPSILIFFCYNFFMFIRKNKNKAMEFSKRMNKKNCKKRRMKEKENLFLTYKSTESWRRKTHQYKFMYTLHRSTQRVCLA